MKVLRNSEQTILVNKLAEMSLLTMAISSAKDVNDKVELFGQFCRQHFEVVDLLAGYKGLIETNNVLEFKLGGGKDENIER